MGELKMTTCDELILLNQSFGSSEEVIDTLASLAKKKGLVEDEYITAIKKREKEFPTGLEMAIPLAIPHISDGCNQPFVSIATLKEPVVFKSMDLSGEDIQVRIVFMFGILDPKSQLAVLQSFVKGFQDKAALERLLAAEAPAQLLADLNEILEGLLDIQ